jgi:hypothetical protein
LSIIQLKRLAQVVLALCGTYVDRYKPFLGSLHLRPVVDMAHYSTFRQELAIAYPTYGNALWEPDPGGQYNAVEVGDVGFIRRGYFQRLFNVLHPKDHPSHRVQFFVPEDHQQLVTIPDHIVKNEIRTGSRQNSLQFCSQYVTLDSRGRGTSASG